MSSNRSAMGHVQHTRLLKSANQLAPVLDTSAPRLEAHHIRMTLLPIGGSERKRAVGGISQERSVYRHRVSASCSATPFSSQSKSMRDDDRASSESLPCSNGANSSLAPPSLPSFSSSRCTRRSKQASPPLFISINSNPITPSNTRSSTYLPPTPPHTTATKSRPRSRSKSGYTRTFPPSPCTPTFDPLDVKRKRMAKLTRYLGEAIPPHLVFGSPGESESQHPLQRRPSWIGEWNREDMRDVQKGLRALKL